MSDHTTPTSFNAPSSPVRWQREREDLDLIGSGKTRHDIRNWLQKFESEANDWAKRLTVRDFNRLIRIGVDDALHRALQSGFCDRVSDFSGSTAEAMPSSSCTGKPLSESWVAPPVSGVPVSDTSPDSTGHSRSF
jgi:hypothetical protein